MRIHIGQLIIKNFAVILNSLILFGLFVERNWNRLQHNWFHCATQLIN